MTGTDKNGLNPARGDRPSCMPGGDYFEPKALPDALPQIMNSPQNCSYGLYGVPLSRGEAQPHEVRQHAGHEITRCLRFIPIGARPHLTACG